METTSVWTYNQAHESTKRKNLYCSNNMSFYGLTKPQIKLKKSIGEAYLFILNRQLSEKCQLKCKINK